VRHFDVVLAETVQRRESDARRLCRPRAACWLVSNGTIVFDRSGIKDNLGRGDVMGLSPTKSYEDLLGDGLEVVLRKGATALAEIVAGLNELNVQGPQGERWTESLLKSELRQLAERSR
jgi:hypothetical protein